MAGSMGPAGLLTQPSGMSVMSQRGESTFGQRLSSFMPLISATAQRLTFPAPKPKGEVEKLDHKLHAALKLVTCISVQGHGMTEPQH